MTHPFDFIKNQVPSLTIQEAAHRLGLGESTIYKYIKNNELKTVPTPEGRVRITEESVKALEKKGTAGADGISLLKLAKELNITRDRLLNTIDEAGITISKVKHGNREQYSITAQQRQQIIEAFQKQRSYPKSSFYYRKFHICLHQAFISQLTNEIYRVTVENGIWGFRTPAGLIPYEEAIHMYKLEPLYMVHGKYRKKNKVVEFRINLTNPLFLSVLDTLYIYCQIENLSFQYKGNELVITVREGRYTVINSEYISLCVDITPYLTKGKISISEQTIILISEDIEITITLSKDEHQELEQLASAVNLTLHEYIKFRLKDRRT